MVFKYINTITTQFLILLISIGTVQAQTALKDISSMVKVHVNSPKRACEIMDSLRNVKFADEFVLDMAQSELYADMAMYQLSIEYGQRAMASDSLKTNFTYQVKQATLLINGYCSINDYQNALILTHNILDNKSALPEAHANRIIAKMLFTLGIIKHKMGEKNEAQDYFNQSGQMLKNSKKSNELALYSYFLGEMTTFAITDEDLNKALILCEEREEIIDKIDLAGGSPEGYTDQQRAYLFSKAAYICECLGDKPLAKKYHDEFIATLASKRVFEGSFIAPYFVKNGQPKQALTALIPVLKVHQQGDTINLNYRSILSDIEQCYSMMGQSKAALNYKKREMDITDSLVHREKYRQTIQMNILYETEQRKALIAIQESKIAIQRAWMVVISLIFIIVVSLLTVIIVSYRRKKRHNEKRYREIMKNNTLRNKENPDEQADKLFCQLEKLIHTERIYLNPELERDALCQALNTNVTYLSAAIKRKTGQTILGYINFIRLDCVKNIIAESEKLDIEQVALNSGFGSSRTLYRQFKEAYGMTPLDFFKLSNKIKDL